MKILLFLTVICLVTWGGVYLNHQHTTAMARSEALEVENAELRRKTGQIVIEAKRLIRIYKRQEMRCREQYL